MCLEGNNMKTFSIINKAIITISRVRDPLRNCPEVIAKIIAGKTPVYLGRGLHRKYGKGFLPVNDIGCFTIWTKGPLSNLTESKPLYEVIKSFKKNKCVLGLEFTITGLGGSFIEPGIPYWKDNVKALKSLLAHTPKILDADAVIVRYDPVLRIQLKDGRILTNMNLGYFKKILKEFTAIGVKRFTTKPLLDKKDDYPSVNKQFKIVNSKVIPIDKNEFQEFYKKMIAIAHNNNAELIMCCNSIHDERAGCIDGYTFLAAGKKLYGKKWDRISLLPRPSRKDCKCSNWIDVGVNKGIKTCFTTNSGCVYCSLSGARPKTKLAQAAKAEYKLFQRGEKRHIYQDIIENSS